ncbi:MAG: 4-hydroxyphenylpyruvate dioxygenase [Gammaproteobacteria bacterium]|nr:4-hydroxyphenylpyruvate dioxygenase [Gammaproteobacteria bacterium]
MAPTDNPMGLDGFEFVEFAAPKRGILEPVFRTLGFEHVADHRSKAVQLWRQNDINFIINYEPKSYAWYLAEEHGPCTTGLAFRVADAHHAYGRALALGAEPVDLPAGPMELRLPAVRGIGGAPLYLIDRYEDASSIYDIDFEFVEGIDRRPSGHGLKVLDHLTHNVYRGRLAHWADFYERLFNFREIRHFDIQGKHSGLVSRALTAPDNKIRIPLNEEPPGGTGQIEAYLMEHNGEGIQHIAFACDDLAAVCDRLRTARLPFVEPPPATYYEMLDERLPGHGEPVDELAERGILIDGDTSGDEPSLLRQVFSKAVIGPIFFEFIERRNNEGFGEGNFQALFESFERDQVGKAQPNFVWQMRKAATEHAL